MKSTHICYIGKNEIYIHECYSDLDQFLVEHGVEDVDTGLHLYICSSKLIGMAGSSSDVLIEHQNIGVVIEIGTRP